MIDDSTDLAQSATFRPGISADEDDEEAAANVAEANKPPYSGGGDGDGDELGGGDGEGSGGSTFTTR